MIQDQLENAIQTAQKQNFTVSEFQLGRNVYDLLKKEMEDICGRDIDALTQYKEIPIVAHTHPDAFCFALSLKRRKLPVIDKKDLGK